VLIQLTRRIWRHRFEAMAIHISSVLEQRLADLAGSRHCELDALVSEVLDAYLTHVEGLTANVREAEEFADREGWVPHEEVLARFNHRLQKSA